MAREETVRSILGRPRSLFDEDLRGASTELDERVREGAFLILGGAGSIGQPVVREIFERRPRRLDVIDLSENNLVELVRDLRSSLGYIDGDFRTLALDCGGPEFDAFLEQSQPYDYVLNLSAMKHVRSERDAFSLMRMVQTNVLNTQRTLERAAAAGVGRYFAVSSDKAANPVNAMGATKRLMELYLVRASDRIAVSSSRFANVAFSDGSLLHGFTLRLAKRQPLAAPEDVRRYFMTAGEGARLCLMAAVLGDNRESFFPRPRAAFQAVDFRTLAERFLESRGYRAHACESEEEARGRVEELAAEGSWPCYFTASETTGEKPIEEFVMDGERVDADRFAEIGVIGWPPPEDPAAIDDLLAALRRMRSAGRWTRAELLDLLKSALPEFRHQETGRFLDARM